MSFLDNLSYGSTKYLDSTKQFLTSNNLVAQIVFFILIVIVFVVLVRIGAVVISYILSPSPNPYLLNGMIDSTKQHTIPQDPKSHGAIPILRSNDQTQGLEFTWNVWIFVDGVTNTTEYRYKHIFNKGNHMIGNDGIASPNNAPGLYLTPVTPVNADYTSGPYTGNGQTMGLLVRMNIFNAELTAESSKLNATCQRVVSGEAKASGLFENDPAVQQATIAQCREAFPALNENLDKGLADAPNIYEDIEIPGIPLNKWVNVIIRCTANNILDVYINGRLTKRQQLSGVARQNYDDVYVALQGGFPGFISNLKYFNYAIGTGEIDSIIRNGPNLTPIGGSNLTDSKPQYLANRWFFNETDPLFTSGLA